MTTTIWPIFKKTFDIIVPRIGTTELVRKL